MKVLLAAALLVSSASAEAADVSSAARPVYRGLERVADAAYGVVRGHLFTALLPGRLSSRMGAVPVGTSDDLFAERFRLRQERASRNIMEARPMNGSAGPAALADWRRTAFRHQTAAFSDALVDALVKRYQLERFGKDSGAYASDISNWDAGFVASAGVLGSAYLYVAGLRTDWSLGPMRVDFDTRAGSAIRSALQGGSADGLASLTLSRRGKPLALKTSWGLRGGRPAAESVGVSYAARF